MSIEYHIKEIHDALHDIKSFTERVLTADLTREQTGYEMSSIDTRVSMALYNLVKLDEELSADLTPAAAASELLDDDTAATLAKVGRDA